MNADYREDLSEVLEKNFLKLNIFDDKGNQLMERKSDGFQFWSNDLWKIIEGGDKK